jgi:hypothetical protein
MTIFAMERLDLGKDSSGRPLVINRRTKAMLDAVEKKIGRNLVIVQGSYLKELAAQKSGPTHDRGGVVDLRTRDQSASQIKQSVVELRKIGFAAWHRTKADGFDPHIHAVAIGDPQLDPSAKRQVTAYLAGKNGLKNGLKDPGPRVEFTVFPVHRVDPARSKQAAKALPAVDLSNSMAQFQAGGTKVLRDVKFIQQALNARHKAGLLVDGKAGPITRKAYKRHQAAIGSAPKFQDGIPGPKDLANLGRGRFRVVK